MTYTLVLLICNQLHECHYERATTPPFASYEECAAAAGYAPGFKCVAQP